MSGHHGGCRDSRAFHVQPAVRVFHSSAHRAVRSAGLPPPADPGRHGRRGALGAGRRRERGRRLRLSRHGARTPAVDTRRSGRRACAHQPALRRQPHPRRHRGAAAARASGFVHRADRARGRPVLGCGPRGRGAAARGRYHRGPSGRLRGRRIAGAGCGRPRADRPGCRGWRPCARQPAAGPAAGRRAGRGRGARRGRGRSDRRARPGARAGPGRPGGRAGHGADGDRGILRPRLPQAAPGAGARRRHRADRGLPHQLATPCQGARAGQQRHARRARQSLGHAEDRDRRRAGPDHLPVQHRLAAALHARRLRGHGAVRGPGRGPHRRRGARGAAPATHPGRGPGLVARHRGHGCARHRAGIARVLCGRIRARAQRPRAGAPERAAAGRTRRRARDRAHGRPDAAGRSARAGARHSPRRSQVVRHADKRHPRAGRHALYRHRRLPRAGHGHRRPARAPGLSEPGPGLGCEKAARAAAAGRRPRNPRGPDRRHAVTVRRNTGCARWGPRALFL